MSAFYDAIARYYDIENAAFVDDLPLYTELAEDYGDPILDVGCGTGRVTFHLAQAGYKTVGLDTSAAMLDIARRKLDTMPHLRKAADLVEADIFDFQIRDFALILLPYNMLMHFTEQEQQLKVLRHVAGLLGDGGALVIDLPNPVDMFAADEDAYLVLERAFTMPDTGNLVMQQSVREVNRLAQIVEITWIYDEIAPDQTMKRLIQLQRLRYVFPSEIRLMLSMCNLEAESWYGDYAYGDFVDGCERMILVTRKA